MMATATNNRNMSMSVNGVCFGWAPLEPLGQLGGMTISYSPVVKLLKNGIKNSLFSKG
jgi:hypothetical protein